MVKVNFQRKRIWEKQKQQENQKQKDEKKKTDSWIIFTAAAAAAAVYKLKSQDKKKHRFLYYLLFFHVVVLHFNFSKRIVCVAMTISYKRPNTHTHTYIESGFFSDISFQPLLKDWVIFVVLCLCYSTANKQWPKRRRISPTLTKAIDTSVCMMLHMYGSMCKSTEKWREKLK